MRAVPSSTPHSVTIFTVCAMDGTRLVGGADDASILVEIFSAAVSIFKQVFLYMRKMGSSHLCLQQQWSPPLCFFFP